MNKTRGFGLTFAVSILIVTSAMITSCTNRNEKNGGSSIKFKQYYIQGEQLFVRHCSNCHQKNGQGLGRLYPPVDKSDFMEKNFEETICLIRNGRNGELVVNGKSFNQPMPGISSLTDLEIAEIATYIYNSWEHRRGIVEVKSVSSILEKCN